MAQTHFGGRKRTQFLALAGYALIEPGSLLSSPPNLWNDLDFVNHLYTDACRAFDWEGNFDKARLYFSKISQALAGTEDLKLREMQGWASWALGGVLRLQDDPGAAEASLRKAQSIALQIGNKNLELDAVHGLGITLGSRGQFRQAEQYYRKVLSQSQVKANPNFAGNVQRDLMLTLVKVRRFGETEELATHSARLLEQVGDERGAVMVDEARGRALIYQGRFKEAERALVQALAEASKGVLPVLERMILYVTLAELYLSQGDTPQGQYFVDLARNYGGRYSLRRELQRLQEIAASGLGPSAPW